MKELGRDSPDYRLKNCCPACTYKLEGEPKLTYEMLVTYDGNDSLKRVLRREKSEDGTVPERGDEDVSTSSERSDSRTARGDYYISRAKVDEWAKELAQKIIPETEQDEVSVSPGM